MAEARQVSSCKYCNQEVILPIHELPDKRNKVLDLYNARLKNSIKEGGEKLRLMQRSSFHLGIHQQPTSQFPDSLVWGLIDLQRLPRVLKDVTNFVNILLEFLQEALVDIIQGQQELEAFILTHMDSVVDSDTAASMQQTLQQTFEYLNDFESRITWTNVPLRQQVRLIQNVHTITELPTSLIIKRPLIFDRSALCVTPSAVHLRWEVAGQQSEVREGEVEIWVKWLETGEEFRKSTCESHIQIDNLLPDTQYQFSVRRVDDILLLCRKWRDIIILKTGVSK